MSIEKLILNGTTYDITEEIKQDLQAIQSELSELDTLIGSGVIS